MIETSLDNKSHCWRGSITVLGALLDFKGLKFSS